MSYAAKIVARNISKTREMDKFVIFARNMMLRGAGFKRFLEQ